MGQTRDDAAGEAFDKIARVMGLPYPGGPEIERLVLGGNDHAIDFPVARLDKPYEFSFSGLKSAVINYLHNQQQAGREVNRSDVAASFQRAVVDALVKEAVHAMQHTGYNKIVLAGGVSANKTLQNTLAQAMQVHKPVDIVDKRAISTYKRITVVEKPVDIVDKIVD